MAFRCVFHQLVFVLAPTKYHQAVSSVTAQSSGHAQAVIKRRASTPTTTWKSSCFRSRKPSNPASRPRRIPTRWPAHKNVRGLTGRREAMIIVRPDDLGVRNGDADSSGPAIERTHLEFRARPADSDNRNGRTRTQETSGAGRSRLAHTLPQPMAAKRPGHRLLAPGLHTW
jgi:hypothetical protein